MFTCTPAPLYYFFFFFNDTAPPEIYPLSLPDALPISPRSPVHSPPAPASLCRLRSPLRSPRFSRGAGEEDRKSTRLNSSHSQISYAVFCLKKKKQRSANAANYTVV